MAMERNSDGIQTLRAKNLDEARRKLFDMYKTDYTIVDKRGVPKAGFLGIFRKDELEVTYKVKSRNQIQDMNPYGNPMNTVVRDESPLDFEKNRAEILKKSQQKNPPSFSNAKVESQITDLNKKLDEMTSMIKGLPSQQSQNHPSISQIEDLLSENEFSFSYIQEISEKIKKTFPLEQLDDFSLVQRTVVDWIGESIKTGIPLSYKRPRVVIIVGPTGVGKTTTLVKLAAEFIKDSKSKGRPADFCLITTDTMRVGALEQLSRFGELVGKSVLKAQNKNDVSTLYEQHKDSVDAIFIDTGGYGPNDASHIASMKETLSVQGLNAEIYLAVSASTKARDLHNIMRNYEPFGYQSVIVTKCDESSQYGNVISALSERHKTLAYVTHGQKIVETLTKGSAIWFLTRLEGFKIDRIHIEDKFYEEDNSEVE